MAHNERKPYGPVKQGNPRSTAGTHPGQVRGKSDPYEHKKQGNPNASSKGQDPGDIPRGLQLKVGNPGLSTRKVKGPRKTGP